MLAGCQTTKEREAVEQRFFVNPTVNQEKHLEDKQICATERDSDATAEGAAVAAGFLLGGIVGMMVMADANADTDAAEYYTCLARRGYQPVLLPADLQWMAQGNTDTVMRGEAVAAYFSRSTADERADWSIATNNGSAEAYRTFLNIHPSGFHAREASDRLTAIALNTKSSPQSVDSGAPETSDLNAPAKARTDEHTTTDGGTLTDSPSKLAVAKPELEVSEPASTLPVAMAVDLPSAMAIRASSTWSGQVVGDGVRGEFGGLPRFCSSRDPTSISIVLENGRITGSFQSQATGEVIGISGQLTGQRISAKVSSGAVESFIFSGTISNDTLTGQIYNPKLISCTSKVTAKLVRVEPDSSQDSAAISPTKVTEPETATEPLLTEVNQEKSANSAIQFLSGLATVSSDAAAIGCVAGTNYGLSVVVHGERFSGQLISTRPGENSKRFEGTLDADRLAAREIDAEGNFFSISATLSADRLSGNIAYATEDGHCSFDITAISSESGFSAKTQEVSRPATTHQSEARTVTANHSGAESVWKGQAVGSGTRTQHGRIFCESSDPNEIILTIEPNGAFSGTMKRSWDGATATMSGSINGRTLGGRLKLPSSFVEYVISGRIVNGAIEGAIFTPSLESCTATFTARSVDGIHTPFAQARYTGPIVVNLIGGGGSLRGPICSKDKRVAMVVGIEDGSGAGRHDAPTGNVIAAIEPRDGRYVLTLTIETLKVPLRTELRLENLEDGIPVTYELRSSTYDYTCFGTVEVAPSPAGARPQAS